MIFFISTALPIFAEEDLTKDKDIKTVEISTKNLEGKAKIGLSIGYPFGVTFGYRFSNYFELNTLVGTNYSSFTLGASGLFTVANFKVSEGFLPLSLGPAVNLHMGKSFGVDILGMLRLEYSFLDIPLNLYIEGGAGVAIDSGVKFKGAGALGVRYIF